MATDNRFLIITGISGSGKTAVSHFLEDLGYYCVDNIPAKLIPSLVELWRKREVEIEKMALVVDMREPGFLKDFPVVLEKIRREFSPRVIFLDASDEALLKRFSESRRPHPVVRRKSVIEAIRLERKRLAPIKKMADIAFDTSSMTVAQLKDLITRQLIKGRKPSLQIALVSFGYKYGIPPDADLIFDSRFLPNPFYVEKLREKTGKSRAVRDYVLKSRETRAFLNKLSAFLGFLIPRFITEGKSYLTIAVGCTGGRHRSVVIVDELRACLRAKKYDIKVYHRDVYK